MVLRAAAKLTLLAVALSALWTSEGHATLFIRCETPQGPLLEFGHMKDMQGNDLQSVEDGFVAGRDGYTGVSPVFMLYDAQPKILWSIWGSTVPDGLSKEEVEEISPSKLEKTFIIKRSNDLIASVAIYPEATWLHTFFPNHGVAYFARHKISEWLELGSLAVGTLLASKCRFENVE